jgi:hypothetical protein
MTILENTADKVARRRMNRTLPKPPKRTEAERYQARQEYQKAYYQLHKEKAKAYQHIYNLTHKKAKGSRGRHYLYTFPRERQAKQTEVTRYDFQHCPAEKMAGLFDQITGYEVVLKP